MTRRSVVLAVVGLAFAAAAGVGLAQITTGSSLNPFAAGPSANDGNHKKTTTGTTTTGTTTTGTTTTTGQTTSATASAFGEGNGQQKFDVCHNADKNNPHTINIAEPAVAAHLAHGDTMGACAAIGVTTSTTGATTTATTSTTTTQATTTTSSATKLKQPKKQKAVKQKAAKPLKQKPSKQVFHKPQKPAKQKPAKQKSSSHGNSGGQGKAGGKGKGK